MQELDDYANSLMNVAEKSDLLDDSLANNKEAAEDVALYTKKMNQGIDKLADGFDDWKDVLDNSDEASEEYNKAMADMKDAMSDVLGVEEEFLTDDFIVSNLEDIEKAAKGDAEAIDRLAVAAGESILIKFAADDKGLQTELLDLQKTLLNTIPDDIKVGATLDIDDFGAAAQDLIDTANMSVEEAQAYFNSLGYEPIFETHEEEVPLTGTKTYTVGEPEVGTVDLEGGGEYHYIKSSVTRTEEVNTGETQKMQVPTLSDEGVPKIKSLRKKSSGAMNNYSGSNKGGKGSGGGGGGSSKKKPIEKKKKTDVVDRYKEITDAIENNTKAMNEASGAADRLYGKSRLAAMQQVNSLLQKEITLNKQKRKDALDNLTIDKTALETAAEEAGIEFTFDENTGDITNYTTKMTDLYKELNDAITQANADEEVSDKEQKEVDAIQEKIDNVKDAIADYEETLELLRELDESIINDFNQWQDNNFEIFNSTIEMNVELNEKDLELIEFQLGKIEDDVYAAAEALALMWNNNDNISQMDVYKENLATYEDSIDNAETGLKALYEAGEISQADYVEGLKEVRSNILAEMENIKALDDAMQNYYGETLAAAQEEIAKYTSLMEHSSTVLDHYSTLLELFGESTNFEAMGVVLEAQSKVAEDSYNVSKANYDMFKNQADERKRAYDEAVASGMGEEGLEMLKQQWIEAETAANEAQDQMLADAEEYAESLRAILENSLAGFAQELEDALTGEFGSFENLASQMERASSLQEEYLTTTNKIYETNKMMRNAQKEIDKTTNSMAKQKLKQFISETAAMQEQGELSQFELDIQQAKYDLLLAEIALKEAQNAKSTVRLQRDSEGNFGYVYTADQSAIQDAQQKYEDAQNALYNKGLEGANDYANKYQQTMSEMYDSLQEIQDKYLAGEYADEAEYQAAMESAKEYYYEKLTQYSNLYQVATTADSAIVADAWSTDFASMITNTEEWKTEVNNYVDQVSGAFSEWSDKMDIIREETIGKDLGDLASKTSEVTDRSAELAEELTKEDGVIDAMGEQLTKVTEVTDAYAAQRDELMSLVSWYEEYLRLLGVDIDAAANDETALAAGMQVKTKAGLSSWSKTDDYTMGTVSGDKDYTVLQYTGDEVLISDKNGSVGWVKKTDLEGFDTGGYTGEWGSYGKMAMLHEKELVLNQDDTANLLASMEFLTRILELIDLQAMSAQLGGVLTSPGISGENNQILEQQVHIEATFPNATNHSEIEEAFNNLINTASQYANRK